MGKGEQGSGPWQSKIRHALFESLPKSYKDRYAAATEIHHAFRAALAETLQDSLNEHLKSVSQDTLAEKQALASWVNAQLRPLGLAVSCPKTALPGILFADFKDADHEEINRFRIEVRNKHGRMVKSFSSHTLFDLTLMEDAPRQEALARGFRNRDRGDRPR